METLGKIKELIGGNLHGDPGREITGFAGIEEAQEGDIAFVEKRRFLKQIQTTNASALIVPPGTSFPKDKDVIVHDNPSKAFAVVVEAFFPERPSRTPAISPKAEIDEGASLGQNVSVDAYVVVREGARIDSGTVLFPFVFVGRDVAIGENCLIYPNVTICDRCIVGNNVIIHSGTVIGGDGFGYISEGGKHKKIPQRGIVAIEDDVEIGSNVTIDRARIDKTVIKRGTKIDNLVMIAHNVKVGEDSMIIAQVGISGSTELGRNVTVAGQAGFSGHIKVGDGCTIGAKSGVIKDLPPNSTVSGFPAYDHRKQLNLLACYRKLPEVFARLERLEKSLKQEVEE
jgi:UDP-3-O-[3-hydroxymyristoyl] glucosamine N-acyltransferase